MPREGTVWFVYVIQSEADDSLYTGISIDPVKRLQRHNSGKRGAKRTRGRGPWRLLGVKRCINGTRARELEYQLKHTTRALKLTWCQVNSFESLRWYKPEVDR